MTASWLDLSRELRAAGWRHTRHIHDGTRDVDGAPNGDEYVEHDWTRGDELITVFHDWRGPVVGYMTFWPASVTEDQGVSVHAGLAASWGPAGLRRLMVATGVIPGGAS